MEEDALVRQTPKLLTCIKKMIKTDSRHQPERRLNAGLIFPIVVLNFLKE